MVRRGGAYVEIGNIWPDSMVKLDISKVLWGQVRIIPVTHYHPSDAARGPRLPRADEGPVPADERHVAQLPD